MKKNEILTALFIAKKNILKNKSSLFFTVIIISLGFISSTIIYGVLNDTSYDMQENYIETTIGHIILETYEKENRIQNVNFIKKKINYLPEIIGITDLSLRYGRLYDSYDNFINTEIYIVNPNDFGDVSVIPNIINQGDWLNKNNNNSIVVGCVYIENCNENIAFDRLSLEVGNKVKIISDNSKNNITLYGIFDHNFIQVELASFVNQETAKVLFNDYNPDEADQILIKLDSRESTNKVIEELSKINLNLKISSWEEKSSKYSSIIDSFLIIGDLSFFIGILISAISIYIILYINILNKKNQIGIIKAIGIRPKVIALSYVFLSFFLGIIGSLLGVLLTFLMVEYFKKYPIVTGVGNLIPLLPFRVIIIVFTTIVAASVISGYFVSKNVIKQNIIEAITNG